MLEAAFWGFVGGRFSFSQRAIGLIMAFGAGVLISAAAFELTEEAFERGGRDAAFGGLALGAVTFFVADGLVDRMGAHRKRSGGQQKEGTAMALVLGALMDGIPESS